MKKILIFVGVIIVVFLFIRTIKVENADKKLDTQTIKEEKVETQNSPKILTGDLTKDKKLVTLSTSKGDIELELYPKSAPKTVDNFLKKVKDGFYNNLTFHRVEDWVVQGGDPDGNGTGGGTMPTELNDLTFSVGSLGVARGQDINISNDSQFFIVKKASAFLDKQYTNFGKVTKGMDVVDKIAIGDRILEIKVR